jgi:aryl-alcohol dehydrogenase-like predicted oxidoreductase
MRYKLFGRSGLRVSEFCLGTATFGVNERFAQMFGVDVTSGADARESRSIFDAFAAAGGNFIDTADVYGDGEGASEKLIGEFIHSDRDHFVISTKYTQSFGKDLSMAGNSRKNMRRCVECSLKRLGTDHIDLYWLHNWDFSTPMDEILRGFDDLVSLGKVGYVAASNVEAWRISSANTLADLRGWAPFIGIQIQYNLLERTAERDLLPMAKELDLGIAVLCAA